MASDSKSNTVAVAIRDTLYAHLFEEDDEDVRVFLPDETPFLLEQYHLGEGLLASANQAPCIYIDDRGSSEAQGNDCGGGIQDDGELLPGFTQDRYDYRVWVWLKGRKEEDMRERMNQWRDAVQACLRAYWHLDDPYRRFECHPASGEPATLMGNEGSATFWTCTVDATVAVQVTIGAATL